MRWSVILAVFLLVVSVSIGGVAKGYSCSVVKLPRGHVALHQGPSPSTPVIAHVQSGAQFVVLDEPDESSDWIHVAVEEIHGAEGLKGWVKGRRIHSNDCG
jgi:hypothetical protein